MNNQTKFKIFFAIITLVVCFSCSVAENQATANNRVEPTAVKSSTTAENKTDAEKAKTAIKQENAPATTDKSKCLKFKKSGKRLIADQTFAIDFEPYTNSCFVTFGNVEDMLDADDLPRGSTFYIYQDGEEVFEFEDAFDGQPACWVEAVGFQDLNGDSQKEVIIAGACLATKDSYPANAVYENTGDQFQILTLDEKAQEFKTVKDISAYVKKNKVKFFGN